MSARTARLVVVAWALGCAACTIGPKPEDPGTPVEDTSPTEEVGVFFDGGADTGSSDATLPPSDGSDLRDATDAETTDGATDGDATADAADGDATDAIDASDATDADGGTDALGAEPG